MSSQDVISLSIPNNAEYVGVVRLAVAGLAARLNYSVDDVENIKIAVSEACSNAIQYAYEDKGIITITCTVEPTELTIQISDTGRGFRPTSPQTKDFDNPEHDNQGLGLGMTFINCLMDEANVESTPGEGTTVTMRRAIATA